MNERRNYLRYAREEASDITMDVRFQNQWLNEENLLRALRITARELSSRGKKNHQKQRRTQHYFKKQGRLNKRHTKQQQQEQQLPKQNVSQEIYNTTDTTDERVEDNGEQGVDSSKTGLLNKDINQAGMDSRCSSRSTISENEYFSWREKRQRLFIYWCFTHFIHGMIHSIRYSSQYLYFKDIMRASNADFLYGLSVSFIGATGVIFPLLISPYIDKTRNIKTAVLVVNMLGLIGNLIYALPFSPVLPLIGQLLAGTTPAFGVIAMGEISRCYSTENLTKRVSGLSLIYSVGTFTSIGLVFCFLYVDFNIGAWNINFANMPGLFLAVAFGISAIISLFLVSDISKEYDLKLEERNKRSSCGSSNQGSSNIPTPETSSRSGSMQHLPQEKNALELPDMNTNNSNKIPLIIEPNEHNLDLTEEEKRFRALQEISQSYFFDPETEKKFIQDVYNSRENEKTSKEFSFPKIKRNYEYMRLSNMDPDDETIKNDNNIVEGESQNKINHGFENAEKCETLRVTLKFIWKILRYRPTAIVMVVTFMEAFVYSIIVTSLPVLAAKFLGWGKVELALLSMINKFLSVIISGSVYFLTDCLHDFLLLTYGICLSLLSLVVLSVLQLVQVEPNAVIVLLFAVAALSISGVPLIITSTRSMLAKIVPTEIQSLSEAVRMSVFEASFVPAGFLVPLVTSNVTGTSIVLFSLLAGLLAFIVYQMRIMVELREDDEYWKDGMTTPSKS